MSNRSPLSRLGNTPAGLLYRSVAEHLGLRQYDWNVTYLVKNTFFEYCSQTDTYTIQFTTKDGERLYFDHDLSTYTTTFRSTDKSINLND